MSCDGRCCAVFTYSVTPEVLRERWEDGPEPSSARGKRHKRDDLYIADMLVELDPVQALERMVRFGIDPGEEVNKTLYTCRHWDEETRLCTAYEDRPKMCADYPYQRACDHGCGYCSPPNVQTEWRAYAVESAFKRSAENSNPSP